MTPLTALSLVVIFTLRTADAQGLRRDVLKRVRCEEVDEAAAGDKVSISYEGRLQADGSVFDSTESNNNNKPINFRLGEGRVIKGWDQGLLRTCPGEQLRLTIPPELAYGSKGAGNGVIPPDATLIFDLTLEDIEKELRIETLEEGDCSSSATRVRRKDQIYLDYTAKLANGTKFDSSFDRGEPLEMIVGKTGVPGWDDGTYGACVGETRKVIVPYRLGYGEEGIPGLVPPKSTVILEMTIRGIEDRRKAFLQQISQGLFG